MKNNNQTIVRKITSRSLRSDKRRNFFIAAAIALTAFMITSVFSVGMSYYDTMMIAPLRSEGMRTHASIGNLSPEKMETLRSLDYVRHISIGYRVGIEYKDGAPNGIGIVALNEESWKYFQTPAFTGIVGTFAKAENEIMLSRALLEYMGIDEPYPGMEIPMDFSIGDFLTGEFGEKQSDSFILSAMYTEYVSMNPGQTHVTIFVSEAFAERHGRHHIEDAIINVIFTNQSRAMEYAKRMAQDLNLNFSSEVVVHPGLERQPETGSSTMYAAIAIFVAFFMFVGFLLIYNVMYISVSKDVRFYGLLKTMGTTPKQLRRIVNGQVLTLYLVGLPIGLALSALTSFAIVPALISSGTGTVVSFSPLIFICGAAFTLLTVYIGASVSARKAAIVSPIEAIRYAGEQNVSIKPRTSANGKPYRMAWRNTFRERKRAFIVMLSLFLGIAVFTGVMGIVNSMDINGNTKYLYDHDIAISVAGTTAEDEFGILGIDRVLIDEIGNIPGVSGVSEQTLGIAVFEYPQEIKESVLESRPFYIPLLEIKGIDKPYMEKLNEKHNTHIDIDAFERGEVVLVDERLSKVPLGDMLYKYFPVGTELFFELGEKAVVPVNTIIGGYITIENMTGWGINMGGDLVLIMSNTFLESVSGKAGVEHLGINIADGMEEPVNATVSAMIEGRNVKMASALEWQRQQEAAQLTMFVLGTTISGILALIGVFNFINLISVGLLTRKRELATLESVGMGKKQTRLMLRWEGAIYWIVTIAASIIAGTGIAYGLFRLVKNQDPMLFPQFIYPGLPVALVFALIVLICTVTPEIAYRGISKMTLVERLREAE